MTKVPLDIRSLAEDVLASPQAADHWLNAPLAALDGRSPLEVARSKKGAQLVAQILAKIDWGAAA